MEQDDEAADRPAPVRHRAQLCFEQIDSLSQRIAELDTQIAAASRHSRFSCAPVENAGHRSYHLDGSGCPCSPMDTFRRGRDFSAWLGLGPKQHSSGGKQRLGRTSKSGQHEIRRLLIIGAMAEISGAKARPPAENSWLVRILARKPRMLAAIALADKMARMLWAMTTKDEEFQEGPLLAR